MLTILPYAPPVKPNVAGEAVVKAGKNIYTVGVGSGNNYSRKRASNVAGGTEKDRLQDGGISYEWLGQSTMRITAAGGFVIYTDPVLLDADPPPADLILITHHHVDHCLPEFVAAVRKADTRLGAFHPSYVTHCAQDIKGVRTVNIGQTVEFGPARVTGVEAYARRGFHMKGQGCGFVIEVSGRRIYFSGDTSATEEMKGLRDIDVAIVSICDNTYHINPEEVVEAVKGFSPRLFIPVHFTPVDEPDAVMTEGMFATKDPRFFTRKEDPGRFAPAFEGTGVELVVLKKLVRFT